MHTDPRRRAWEAAARAAVALVEDGMRVGLGTGRAATCGIAALGERVRAGLRVTAVPTSPASARAARDAGIPVGRLNGPLDIAFDGADAVDPAGLTVKGHGGAMVRERVVAAAARRFLVLVDRPKLVGTLDDWGTLPTVVVPFSVVHVMLTLGDLGPVARPNHSDDGMTLVDLHPPAGADWEEVAARVRALPGVLDHGLFELHLGDVLVGTEDGGVTTAQELAAGGGWPG